MHIVTKSGTWAGVQARITDLITRFADGQMSSQFQESCNVVSQTMKGLSGMCEEKHMSGILGTSGVDRTFRTERHREHGQRDHVTEEQTKRRARMARQVWVKCGTKTKPLELNDETPEEIERKVRWLVNVNSSEKGVCLVPGKSCSMVEVDGDGGRMYLRGDASYEGGRETETEEEEEEKRKKTKIRW